MKQVFSLRCIAPTLAVLTLLASPVAFAHDGHQADMSDEEMILMEMDGAEHGGTMMDSQEMGGHHEVAHPDDDDMIGADDMPQEFDRVGAAEEAMQAAIAENRATSVEDFLGRLHPIAVHFPVALLLAAAIAEIMLVIRPNLGMGVVVRFLVAGGAAGATVAALLGWFAAGWRLTDRSETLGFHRWNGTAITVASLIAAWFAFKFERRSGLRVMLTIIAFALLFQGYLGGEMVHGPNHLGIR